MMADAVSLSAPAAVSLAGPAQASARRLVGCPRDIRNQLSAASPAAAAALAVVLAGRLAAVPAQQARRFRGNARRSPAALAAGSS